jgi:hypothetical protein
VWFWVCLVWVRPSFFPLNSTSFHYQNATCSSTPMTHEVFFKNFRFGLSFTFRLVWWIDWLNSVS